MSDNRHTEDYNMRLNTDQFHKELGRLAGGMSNFEREFGAVTNQLAKYASIGFATKKLYDFGEEVINLGKKMETTRVMMKTLFGGNEGLADQMISKFQQLAKESPFNTQDVLQGARLLRAYGFEADSLIPTMKRLGDITSALDLNFNDVVWLYGHSKTLGTMDKRVLREFSTRGINLFPALSKIKGVSEHDLHQKGAAQTITFQDIEKAITMMTSKGGQFFGLMEARSKTVAGQWERLKDTIEIIETSMGEKLNPLWAEMIGDAADFVNTIGNVDMEGTKQNLAAIYNTLKDIVGLAKSLSDMLGLGEVASKMGGDWRALNSMTQQSALYMELLQKKAQGQAYYMTHGYYNTDLVDEEFAIKEKIKQRQKEYTDAEKKIETGGEYIDTEGRKRKFSSPDFIGGGSYEERMERIRKNQKAISFGESTKNHGIGGEGDEETANQRTERLGGVKNITINITKMVDKVDVTYASLKSVSTNELTDAVKMALMTALTDANLAVG